MGCGLIERSGQGMDLIYELTIREAKPLPDFTDTDDYFVFITLNGIIQDKRMILLIKKIGEDMLESFTTEDFLVIDALFHGKKITSGLRLRMKRLSDMGIVEHIGHGKYVFVHDFHQIVGKPVIHVQHGRVDRDADKKLILRHIKNNDISGTSLKELQKALPNYSRSQLQFLLRELRKENQICMEGNTSAAKWFCSQD